MSSWPAVKAKRLLKALERIGWVVERQSGSHRWLAHPDGGRYVFAFHDDVEIGPVMLKRVARDTGLKAEDL
ncbi:MAG: type II toxin-antitoxin system HicA family toxin [Pseudomonadota bacterium]